MSHPIRTNVVQPEYFRSMKRMSLVDAYLHYTSKLTVARVSSYDAPDTDTGYIAKTKLDSLLGDH